MRKYLISASIFAIAAPAAILAQPPLHPEDEEIVRNLPSPREAEEIGRVMGDVADAVLDVPVGPMIDAIDPGRRLSRRERDRTLGDIASRDDPRYRERMRRSMDAISIGMGDMVAQMAVLAPVLRRTMEDVERRIEDATHRLPDARGHDRDNGDEPSTNHRGQDDEGGDFDPGASEPNPMASE